MSSEFHLFDQKKFLSSPFRARTLFQKILSKIYKYYPRHFTFFLRKIAYPNIKTKIIENSVQALTGDIGDCGIDGLSPSNPSKSSCNDGAGDIADTADIGVGGAESLLVTGKCDRSFGRWFTSAAVTKH